MLDDACMRRLGALPRLRLAVEVVPSSHDFVPNRRVSLRNRAALSYA